MLRNIAVPSSTHGCGFFVVSNGYKVTKLGKYLCAFGAFDQYAASFCFRVAVR
jgi:hypothetical protein